MGQPRSLRSSQPQRPSTMGPPLDWRAGERRRTSPAPHAHARVLLDLYGYPSAHRIAQRNARRMEPDPYWARVLAALQRSRYDPA